MDYCPAAAPGGRFAPAGGHFCPAAAPGADLLLLEGFSVQRRHEGPGRDHWALATGIMLRVLATGLLRQVGALLLPLEGFSVQQQHLAANSLPLEGFSVQQQHLAANSLLLEGISLQRRHLGADSLPLEGFSVQQQHLGPAQRPAGPGGAWLLDGDVGVGEGDFAALSVQRCLAIGWGRRSR